MIKLADKNNWIFWIIDYYDIDYCENSLVSTLIIDYLQFIGFGYIKVKETKQARSKWRLVIRVCAYLIKTGAWCPLLITTFYFNQMVGIFCSHSHIIISFLIRYGPYIYI
jgi:hypothetical protein